MTSTWDNSVQPDSQNPERNSAEQCIAPFGTHRISCWDRAYSNELSHATGGHSYRPHDAHNRHVARTKGGSAAFTFVLAGCESPRMRGALLATVPPPSVGTARLSIRAIADSHVSLWSGIDPAARCITRIGHRTEQKCSAAAHDAPVVHPCQLVGHVRHADRLAPQSLAEQPGSPTQALLVYRQICALGGTVNVAQPLCVISIMGGSRDGCVCRCAGRLGERWQLVLAWCSLYAATQLAAIGKGVMRECRATNYEGSNICRCSMQHYLLCIVVRVV